MLEIDVRRLARIRYVTNRFPLFQGLSRIPFGLAFLVYAIPASTFGSGWGPYRLAVLWFAAAAAWWPIDRYYKRTFGRVNRTPERTGKEVLGAFPYVGAYVLSGMAVVIVGPAFAPVLLAVSLGLAVWLLFVWRRHATILPTDAVLAVLVALLGLCLLLLPDRTWADDTGIGWPSVGLAAAFVLGGVLDHLVLARTLRPVEQADVRAV